MSIKRKYGEEQPSIKAGIFRIRIPFIHYKFEIPDYFQGLLMCAVCLSAIPMLQEYLGMPFEVAMAVVALNGILYCLHVFLGDPVVPGWITPAIPLLLLYVGSFDMGVDRIHALIAFEFTLGLLALILGVTGLGKKLISVIPNAMQSGLIIGSGFAAVIVVFKSGERFDSFPITISICVGIAFYLLFSNHFKSIAEKNRVTKIIANLGVLPVVLLAVVIGPLVGEAVWPTMEMGINVPAFGKLFHEWTIFGVGLPPLSMFISGLPMVFSTYIILFGDMIQSKALLDDAQKSRPDEKIDYNPSRSHIIFGIRNMIMSVFGPDVTMCGPLWAAMQVVICERYKKGPKAMESINSGAASFRFGTLTGYFLLPIISLVKPILDVAMALTMLIQGFVSVKVGILKAKTMNDLGIAGVMGAILATRGAAWGLAAGIILCLLIKIGNKKYEEDIQDNLEGTSTSSVNENVVEEKEAK